MEGVLGWALHRAGAGRLAGSGGGRRANILESPSPKFHVKIGFDIDILRGVDGYLTKKSMSIFKSPSICHRCDIELTIVVDLISIFRSDNHRIDKKKIEIKFDASFWAGSPYEISITNSTFYVSLR